MKSPKATFFRSGLLCRKLGLLVAMITLFLPFLANATSIIRDSEIEHAIKQVTDPIVKAANLKRLKIHILLDDQINAFTAGGEEIFASSGLITSFSDPDLFRGVMAHEIGHILGKHVLRQIDNIEQQKKAMASSLAIGLASALAGNGAIAQAAILGGMHYSERSILKSSRVYESSADQAGLRLLEKSGNTSAGLLKLLEYFYAHQNRSYLNPYELTHPLSSERLHSVEHFYATSKFKNSTTTPAMRYNFLRAAAKLKAFTVDISSTASISLLLSQEVYKNIPRIELEEITTYTKAIIAFRKSDAQTALQYIDTLISNRPQDPYYHELKGQILFEFGKKEAYESYATAAKLAPNDALIRLGRAVVAINVFERDPVHLKQAIDDLKFAQEQDKDNALTDYFLSVAYEKIGDKPRSLIAATCFAAKQGELKRAKSMARAIIKDFKDGTPEWHKLNDIILTDE